MPASRCRSSSAKAAPSNASIRQLLQKLSSLRAQTAQRLGRDVSALMDELGMRGGSFEAQLEATGGAEQDRFAADAQGRERVEFLVSANPGQPLRALRKAASGGELSRISLAIEVAALGLDEIGTMVFDEVDAGISGAIAEVVGQKLRRLGGQRQSLVRYPSATGCGPGDTIICAGGEIQRRKEIPTWQQRVNIDVLDDKSRRDEIARMLGGIEITRETLAHAKQMLAKGLQT